MDLCTGILLLLVVRECFRRPDIKLFLKPFIFPLAMMLGYFLVAILGYVFNASPDAHALTNLSKFSWIAVFILFAICFFVEKFNPIELITYYSFVFFIPALYSLNIFINHGTDFLYGRLNYWRVVGLINSATYHAHIGGFILVSFFILLFYTFKKIPFRMKIFATMSFLLIAASTAFTMTRGVWIASALSLLIFLLTWNWKKTLLLLTSSLVFVLFVFNVVAKKNLLIREDSDICRKRLIEVHVNMVTAYPLLGIGYRDNMRDLKPYWPVHESPSCLHLREEGTHAHNQFLNVAATTGLLGLVFFGIIWIYFFGINILLIRQAQKTGNTVLKRWTTTTLILLVYFSLTNMTETDFEYAKVRLPLLIVWGLLMALHSVRRLNLSADTLERSS
jgi:O-antigen ligase